MKLNTMRMVHLHTFIDVVVIWVVVVVLTTNMTTAHRPTWKAAVGKGNEGGWAAGGAPSSAKSHLDLGAHTQLKLRTGRQLVDKKKALKESLLKLEQAESKAASSERQKLLRRVRQVDQEVEEQGRMKLLKQTAEVDEQALKAKYDDADADDDDDDDNGGGGRDVGKDDDSKESDDLDASDSEDDSDDDDDDEAALQAELAKIRAERDTARAKVEAQAADEEESRMEEAALLGNPLLAAGGGGGDVGSGKLKRKWNDDVVFRNQAKGEPKIKKRFINDTVRNDFHKRFLNKFFA
jgi:protein CWC15